MGIFQELAILGGDLVTQPIRKALVEKWSGYNFKIKRLDVQESSLENHIARRYVHHVSWELIVNGKKEKSKPEHKFK